MLSENIKNDISVFLEEVKQNIIQNHLSHNQKATGNFINGLTIVENDNGASLIDNAGYSYFLEYGRMPTSSGGGSGTSLVKRIEQWMSYKGLEATKQFNPYSIANKIHKEGTSLYRILKGSGSGSGVITGAINDKSITDFFNSISEKIQLEAFSEVSKELTI